MPIESIPDWEMRIARHDACWEGEIIDRPVVWVVLDKLHPEYLPTRRTYGSQRERWLDAQGAAEIALANAMNHEYLGDALPSAYPFLGGEVFSAFFGCELEFTEDSAWSIPNLRDWSQISAVRFSEGSFYWKKIIEFTDAYLALGASRFYTGITDLHSGGDALAAFRDPMQLNLDLMDARDKVKDLLEYVNRTYQQVYTLFFHKLIAAGQPICTWMPVVSSKEWYVISNDFSCMVSSRVFDEVFLPGIAEECRLYDACIYHLDGPGAIRHLDSLLEIKELNAIQWVPGAGQGGPLDWIPLYQKCQAAGKGLQIATGVSDVSVLREHLKPEGVCLFLWDFDDRAHVEWFLKDIATWR